MESCWQYKTLWEAAPSKVTFLNWIQDLSWGLIISSIWKHTTCVTMVFVIFSQLWLPIEFKFQGSRFVILSIQHTPSLTITKGVQCLLFSSKSLGVFGFVFFVGGEGWGKKTEIEVYSWVVSHFSLQILFTL